MERPLFCDGVLALLLLTVAGCSPQAQPPVAPAPAPPPAGSSDGAELLRYRASACPLRYEMRATLAGSAGPRVETRRTFEVRATAAGTTLTGNTRILPPGAAGDVSPDTSGLSILFPELPAASAPGSTRAWNLQVPRARDGRDAERTRAAHAADLQLSPTEPIIASVRLDGWVTIRGVRAATLSMDGIQRLETAKQTVSGSSATLQGSYVMLATGRLLHASVARSSVVGALPTVENIEARLVGACDGPTEPSFDTL